jgi:hypothetical protein
VEDRLDVWVHVPAGVREQVEKLLAEGAALAQSMVMEALGSAAIGAGPE